MFYKMLIFVVLLLVSCQPKHERDYFAKINRFSDSKTETCTQDSTQSYALYLPTGYSDKKKYPVIFCFDSHARGTLPVEKLKQAAERFGYIIAGSNNVRNNSTDLNHQIQTLFSDVEKKYSIDEKRKYLCGFSGGARIAVMIAARSKNIGGVIGCGAGFPQINPNEVNFDYFGAVGKKDFNYLEMKNLNNVLAKYEIGHYISFFDGQHQWPPPKTMQDALLFLHCKAMKRQIIPKNEMLIKQWSDNEQKRLQDISNPYRKLQIHQKQIAFLGGIYDIEPFHKEVEKLKNDPQTKKMQQKLAKTEQIELNLRKGYIEAIENKTIEWWKNEIGLLRERAKGKAPLQAEYCERLLNFLSMMTYMYCEKYLKNKQVREAGKIVALYEILTPENPDMFYFKAALNALQKNNDTAIQYLNKAIELGFSDTTKIYADDYFDKLSKKQSFQRLIDKMGNSP